MNITQIFSPLKHNLKLFLFLLLFFFLMGNLVSGLFPQTQKITIHFLVKPLDTYQSSTTNDIAQTTEKITQMISSWAKSPKFRENIMNDADYFIPKFKRQITAKKQNHLNLYWTLKLYDEQIQYEEKITQAIIKNANQLLEEFSENNPFPVSLTSPQIFSEPYKIPTLWLHLALILLALALASTLIYLREAIRNKFSFDFQLKHIFPESPIFTFSENKNNPLLLEAFIQTFNNPHLIPSFPVENKNFNLSTLEALFNQDEGSPIIIVKRGQTSLCDLKNMKSIFGDSAFIGIIICE